MVWICHIDMDAFFASIEQLDDPSLRDRPVVVGNGLRGVVSAASYEARRFGVHSAMPVSTARRLCPEAIFVSGRRERYREVSHKVMTVLHDFSPYVEPASIDEAYLDATGLERLFGPVDVLARRIKEAVRAATGGLSCSVGAAPVKFLAKIASDVNKPDGLFILPPHQVAAFLHLLPVGRLPGVGRHFLASLASLGVRTAGDVLRYPEEFWERRFGKAGRQLFERAEGRDPRRVETLTIPKSESAESTFAEDTGDRAFLQRRLMAHAERVGTSLRRHGLSGRTVTLKVKYADFRQITRSRTLPLSTAATETIFETACSLLEALRLEQKVRLIGLGVSGFEHRAEQMLLPVDPFPAAAEKRRKDLDNALDILRARFGQRAVVRGRLFGEEDD